MKIVEVHGRQIPVKDEVQSLEEALNRPLVEIKVDGEDEFLEEQGVAQ